MKRLPLLISLSLSVLTPPVNSADGPRPNIILILADDLGWSDIGCCGGEINTPTFDRLAAHKKGNNPR